MALDVEAAQQAVADLAGQMNLSPEAAARGCDRAGERQHRAGGAAGVGRARARSAQIHAGRLRRGRSAARLRSRRALGHPARADPARAGGAVRARLAGRGRDARLFAVAAGRRAKRRKRCWTICCVRRGTIWRAKGSPTSEMMLDAADRCALSRASLRTDDPVRPNETSRRVSRSARAGLWSRADGAGGRTGQPAGAGDRDRGASRPSRRKRSRTTTDRAGGSGRRAAWCSTSASG